MTALRPRLSVPRRFPFFMGGMMLLASALFLSACGREGPPQAPGPADQITYPHSYPSD
ncbi:lipoprotein [Oecophyllibacter saccharovorans]|uniref:lipoprotein n=1 Tax=Oecophyllibacter saccharovorans TaxID=2558360 RepID=UPI00143DB281